MDEQLKNESLTKSTNGSSQQNGAKEDHGNNGLAEKRGRLISAAVIATIILSVIAVSVFGIFQITSKMLIVCPQDLPVNDPAPVLWQDIVSDKTKIAKLGVSDKLSSVYLKGLNLATGKAQ